jgi:hypothetical protein
MPATLQAAGAAAVTREQSAIPVHLARPRGTVPHRDGRRRLAGLITRLRWTSYHDSLFERPDLIEDDYYRFLNQPRG